MDNHFISKPIHGRLPLATCVSQAHGLPFGMDRTVSGRTIG
jgi:hypothetical protein